MKVAHLSDLHFGRHVSNEQLEALRYDLISRGLDIIVISGDITDRGTVSQFRWARDFLQDLNIPFMSVPGNREISVTAFWEWMFPGLAMRRYGRFFGSPDRILHRSNGSDTVFFGLNSVHPFPSWPGTIRRDTRHWLREQAGRFPDCSKVLVLHHPVLPVVRSSSFWAHTLSDAGEVLNICSHVGITLILQGHKHRSSIMEIRIPERNTSVVVSASGAPLVPHWDPTYHVIDISATIIVAERREFSAHGFVERGTYGFSFPEGATRGSGT
ncbi:MAG: metallophosphoesterase [Desulfomonilaceae bacterium]|nr:metallophosphoesterase [Desulfomonilaceae bacterium]